MNLPIAVDICTKGRYFSTLPLTIQSILNQTKLPSQIIIYDDNEKENSKDLRGYPIYQYLFQLMEIKGIEWSVVYGNGRGQVLGHQFVKENAKYDWVFRIDDDEVAESNVLENLFNCTEDGFGGCYSKKTCIVAPLVIDPNSKKRYPLENKSTNVNYIIDYQKFNYQWFYSNHYTPKGKNNYYRKAEHVYSCFLYNRKKCLDFHLKLSKVGHGEETIFSYRNHCHKNKSVVSVNSIVWHYRNPEGGIRNGNKDLFESDSKLTNEIINDLKDWNGEKIIIIQGGIGDHFAFRNAIDIRDLKIKYGEIWFALAHPETFYDIDVKKISIKKAIHILSEKIVDRYDVYKYMRENGFDKNGKNIRDAYREIWL